MAIRRHQKSTLKDVASRAQVSATTVSLFASGREDICSSSTAERIREAIEHLRYTPNSLSRSLRTRSTGTIGMVIERPHEPIDQRYSFMERFWRGADSELDHAGLCQLHYPQSVRAGISMDPFLDGRVDGLIYHGRLTDVRAERIAASGMPTVLITRPGRMIEGCGAAHASESDVVELAMSHLWRLGHRAIGHITGPVEFDESENSEPSCIALARRANYIEWMKTRTAFQPEHLVIGNDYIKNNASKRIAAAFDRWKSAGSFPTAIFCINDEIAIETMRIASEFGLKTPNDLSVVGVDNQIMSMFSSPQLTTVEVPAEEIGREAVRALLRLVEGAPVEECRTELPVTHLVVRGSTARPGYLQ